MPEPNLPPVAVLVSGAPGSGKSTLRAHLGERLHVPVLAKAELVARMRAKDLAGTLAAATPRLRIESACLTLGRAEVIRRCVALIDGGEVDPEFLVTIGGGPATRLLADGLPEDQLYWLRVWALRGLLWASPGDHVEVLRRALEDDHWRVREMACKVIARHHIDEVLDAVVDLQSDSVDRVRRAAERAVTRVVDSGPAT